MASREDLVYKAKLAEKAERYHDMVEAMNSVAKLDEALTVEERNLLSVGYKNLIGPKRASMRVLSSIETKEDIKGNGSHVKQTTEYRQKVEAEVEKICCDAIEIIDNYLIPHSSSAESTVFYNKMKGDYFRYLAEFKIGTEKINVSELSLKAYETASQIAETDLSPINPARLGVALNMSIFYYEIMNSPDKACQLAQRAFDEAVSDIDSVSEESYKDSTLLMQLMRDNLSLWNSDMADDAEDVRERAGKIGASGDSAGQQGTGNTGA